MRVWLSVVLGLSCLLVRTAAAQETPKPGLKVTVTSGDGLIHNLRDPKPQSVVVKVTGADGLPVSGAVVFFQLPDPATPSGAFREEETSEETTMLTRQTNAEGNAVARGLRPNAMPGKWVIRTKVTHLGTTVDIEIPQINQEACRPGYRAASPPTGFCVKPGGSGKWIALVAAGGAAAVGAAVGLGSGKGGQGGASPTPTPTPTTPPTSPSGAIRLGSITIGPP